MLAGLQPPTCWQVSSRSIKTEMTRLNQDPGSGKANYSVERSATDAAKPAFATLSAVNITVSKILGAGVTMTRGKKDIPPALAINRVFESQAISAGQWYVIMYDTLGRRAWLLDGASALVHISRAGLSLCNEQQRIIAEANEESYDESKFKADQLWHPPDCEGRQSALKVLLNNKNRQTKIFASIESREKMIRDPETGSWQQEVVEQTKTWWRWEDLVREKFAVLEMLHDQCFRRRQTPVTDVRLPFGNRSIEGFEFDDLVHGFSPLQPRVTDLETAYGDWLDFTVGIDAITLFGSGFGDLIKPAEDFSGGASRTRCGQRAPCPENHDYLAAPISLVSEIRKRHKTRKDNCVQLGEKIFWQDSLVPMENCDCAHKRCSIQTVKLQTDSLFGRQPMRQASSDEVFKRYARGAIIFGSGTTHATHTLRTSTPATPQKNARQPSMKGKERDSGIDMGDSSGSNVPLSSPRTDSPPDSGAVLNTTRRAAWVREASSNAGSYRQGSSHTGRSGAEPSRASSSQTESLRQRKRSHPHPQTSSGRKTPLLRHFFGFSSPDPKSRQSLDDTRPVGSPRSHGRHSSRSESHRQHGDSPARSKTRRDADKREENHSTARDATTASKSRDVVLKK